MPNFTEFTLVSDIIDADEYLVGYKNGDNEEKRFDRQALINFVQLYSDEVSNATVKAALGSDFYVMDQAVKTTDNVTFNNISPTGTVDGRDVATDGVKLDTISTNADVTLNVITNGVETLTSTEVNQLKNIDSATITTANWSYVPSLNQNLSTTSSVVFNKVNKLYDIDVYSSADLPTPVGGYHPLANDTNYRFYGNVTLTDGLDFGDGSSVICVNVNNANITYTGTNPFLISSGGYEIECRALNITHFSAPLLSFNSASKSLGLYRVNCVGLSGGTITEMFGHAFDSCFFGFLSDGFTYAGAVTYEIFLLKDTICQFLGSSGTMINWNTRMFNTISITHSKFILPSGTTGISGTTSSGNVGNAAKIIGNDFEGAGTKLVNIDISTNLKYTGFGNTGIGNYSVIGGGVVVNNVTPTTFTTGVWTPILGTYIQSPTSSRSTCSSAGVITFNQIEEEKRVMMASLSFYKSGGTGVSIEIAVYKNGSIITNYVVPRTATTSVANASMIIPITINTSDYYQLYARNISNSDSVIFSTIQINTA